MKLDVELEEASAGEVDFELAAAEEVAEGSGFGPRSFAMLHSNHKKSVAK